MQEKICVYHEKDIALTLPQLTDAECQRLFLILTPKNLAAILEYSNNPASYFELLKLPKKAEVLSLMEISTTIELLEQLSAKEVSFLSELLEPRLLMEINLIRSFDKNKIGSRISTNFISILNTSTVKEAMSSLILQATKNDNISTLYLTDDKNTFCGAVDLKYLITASKSTPLSEISKVFYPYLYAKTDIEDCITLLTDYSEASLPVLDDDNKSTINSLAARAYTLKTYYSGFK